MVLAFTIIPSLCNFVVGNVVVFVLEKTFVPVLEGKLACGNFPSLCNVCVGNVVFLVLERKLSFMVQCGCWQCVIRKTTKH
jgi:hypothetical protein